MVKESSFFEKLKKGMGIEGPVEEGVEEVEKKPPKESLRLPTGQAKKARVPRVVDESKNSSLRFANARVRKLEIKAEPIEPELEKIEEPEAKREKIKEGKPSFAKATEGKEKWFESEGQLAIDVYQTENELIVQSAIAGVKPENLDISIERDVLTVKGIRQKPLEETGDYFAQECYWGPFSREVILPVEVDPGRVEATMKEGILTIRIPKILRERKRKIAIKS